LQCAHTNANTPQPRQERRYDQARWLGRRALLPSRYCNRVKSRADSLTQRQNSAASLEPRFPPPRPCRVRVPSRCGRAFRLR
jgi:hypothetical protein